MRQLKPTVRMIGIAVFCLMVGPSLAETEVDLRQIGHVAPMGRIQDKKYQEHLPVIDALIKSGTAAIPFLLSKIEDDTEIKGHVFDYWPRVYVGDVALAILTDFFTPSDSLASTVPGLSWDELLERSDSTVPAWVLLQDFVAKHGRIGLWRKIERVLQPYNGHFTWDVKERCFRPTK